MGKNDTKAVQVTNGYTMLSRRTALFSGLAFGAAACGQQPNLIGVPTTRAISAQEIEERSHRIYIATMRRPSDEPGELFSGKRSYRLNFAAVDVLIPPTHQTGQIERPRASQPDPDKHFVITNPQVFENEIEMRSKVDGDILKLPRGNRTALLWVHGYNTNLTTAVLRLAQFVEDTGYTGVPILYSWASEAQIIGYVYDANSALIARDNLEDVPEILRTSPIESLDIVAHSMGNFLVMEAARGVASRRLFNVSGKIRNVILASPDIDIDVFAFQLSTIPPEHRKFIFVLTSADDEALQVSQAIARRPRVGQLTADQLKNLDVNVIDLSQVEDVSSIHHSKFADAPEVVRLIGERLREGDAAGPPVRTGTALILGASGRIIATDEL